MEHLELDHVGHLSMVIDPRTTHALTARLRHLDHLHQAPGAAATSASG